MGNKDTSITVAGVVGFLPGDYIYVLGKKYEIIEIHPTYIRIQRCRWWRRLWGKLKGIFHVK